MNYGAHFQMRVTPQSEPVPGKNMAQNNAGGFGFAVDDWTRLHRFLILGSEGGSYYATEKKLTVENAQCVMRCLDSDPIRTIDIIAQISHSGRAPKNDPAVFALAMAAGYSNPEARKYAAAALPRVCRIGTHLFQFIEAVQGFRGWGKGLRKAVAGWYEGKTADELAYQVVKYQQRNGVSHRDVLRLAHVQTDDQLRQAIYRWVVGGDAHEREVKRGKGENQRVTNYGDTQGWHSLIVALQKARVSDEKTVCHLIRIHDLPRECIPTEHLNSPEVWGALLEKMPLTALVRSLAKMTGVGLVTPMSDAAKLVADKLGDQEHIRKSRLHPLAILLALKTYAAGHGEKGKLSWIPVDTINDALDSAFYLAFGNVEPANKRTLIGLDVSGSMSSTIAGTTLSCAEAGAAMAMIQARTEPQYQLMAFAESFRPIDISKASRLSDVVRLTKGLNFGGTDCALPMIQAQQKGWQVDTFAVYTDSETWAGGIQPCQALVRYREKTGIPARLVVVGMTSGGFTIADPTDAGMLDVVGFDAATPQIITDFSAGRV
jgi:60 kDa SS-A/Ro ribonucleoprotein